MRNIFKETAGEVHSRSKECIGGKWMTCDEIIEELKANASEKYKANVVKMGIPAEYSIGVSTTAVRAIAKKAGKSNELAGALWSSGYHEAKLMAVLVFDKKTVSHEDIEKLILDVQSWDLCDHLCKNLIIKLKGYDEFIPKWVTSTHTYKKRAAFTLIASSVIHNKVITNEALDEYLRIIQEYSDSEHEHVKKAISWALREIGKRDFKYNEKAILLAYEMKESGNKNKMWIAKDALKELETLVKVEGRGRLISSNTKMGSE